MEFRITCMQQLRNKLLVAHSQQSIGLLIFSLLIRVWGIPDLYCRCSTVCDIRNNICSFVSYPHIISTGECRYPRTTSVSLAKINLCVERGFPLWILMFGLIREENLLVYTNERVVTISSKYRYLWAVRPSQICHTQSSG